MLRTTAALALLAFAAGVIIASPGWALRYLLLGGLLTVLVGVMARPPRKDQP